MFPNKKMSSMYLHHIIGFSSKASRIFSSKSAINKIAYGEANFVPIAVPCTKNNNNNNNNKAKKTNRVCNDQ